ncbi:hypothetical protein PENANT_c009G10537 [Penicillium antarcticum]|uniref:Uncharacterized protein n=1 Tax=Penicillium antarcticum TaxID=416450 RepID=A0A1V6Q9J0_9EURO|nr:hypothetical protein PENANT_c009G10537 [Penicillium antarcticum]
MFRQALDLAGERHGSQRRSTESCQELFRESKSLTKSTSTSGLSGMALQVYELEKESPASNTVLIKEFIWWYTLSTGGRLR